MAMGTPQYGNTDMVFYKNWKLKSPDTQKGETVFVLPDLRIVPPLHSLAEKGFWARYHGQHFGYAGNAKEPGKVRQRPFACIQQTDFRTKIVTVECAACDIIEEKRSEREAREAEYKSKGKNEQEIRELLEPLTQWLKKHNCDRKWHINCMDRAGNFGVLQISHTLKKALDVKLDEMRNKRKIEPIDKDSGVWIRFSRMGKFPVQDSVEVVMSETADGRFEYERCPLTEQQCEQAEKVCPDLQSGVVKTITAAQIAQLVGCSGDPDEVDRIWAQGSKTVERSTPPRTTPVAQPVTTSQPKADAQGEIEKLRAQLAALEATKAKPVETKSEDSTETNLEELSDEEFYEKYGPPKTASK
jgi:hypothetical protein